MHWQLFVGLRRYGTLTLLMAVLVRTRQMPLICSIIIIPTLAVTCSTSPSWSCGMRWQIMVCTASISTLAAIIHGFITAHYSFRFLKPPPWSFSLTLPFRQQAKQQDRDTRIGSSASLTSTREAAMASVKQTIICNRLTRAEILFL